MQIKTIVSDNAAEFDLSVNLALKDGYKISEIKAENGQFIALLRYDEEWQPIKNKCGFWLKRECPKKVDEKGYHFECSECGTFRPYTPNYCETCGSWNERIKE